MKFNEYKFNTSIWLYPGKAAWHFVTIPEDISEDITTQFGDAKRGWGSIRVKATVGKTSWETSIFPDKKSNGYLLPIKAEVRKKEELTEGDTILLLLEIQYKL